MIRLFICAIMERMLLIKVAVILLLVFAANRFKAQETSEVSVRDTLNSAIVEKQSYELYLRKKWPELIQFGSDAIRKGYDYFYIQMRVGIAYYECANYLLAEKYFLKALSFNSGDELAMEYLYYCYVFTGRSEQARWLSKDFTRELAEKTGTAKKSGIDFILLEGGTKLSDSAYYYNAGKRTKTNYFDPPFYLHVGINHSVKNRFSLFHAGSYFSQKSFIGLVNQSQYYLKGSIPFKRNWMVLPAFQLVNIKFASEVMPVIPPTTLIPPPQPTVTVSQSTYYISSLAVLKSAGKFRFGLINTFSNMLNANQFLHSGSVSYSVFGNSKLILGCTGYWHTKDSYSTINTAVTPFIYVQPNNWLSVTANYFSNSKHNIIEENGYLVNNSPDLTTSRWSFLASVNINKHLGLYGLYQLEYKTEVVQLFKYQYNVLVGGLRITL